MVMLGAHREAKVRRAFERAAREATQIYGVRPVFGGPPLPDEVPIDWWSIRLQELLPRSRPQD